MVRNFSLAGGWSCTTGCGFAGEGFRVIIVGLGLDALRLYRYVLGQTDGATPLYVASERGRLSVVVALLDAGAV